MIRIDLDLMFYNDLINAFSDFYIYLCNSVEWCNINLYMWNDVTSMSLHLYIYIYDFQSRWTSVESLFPTMRWMWRAAGPPWFSWMPTAAPWRFPTANSWRTPNGGAAGARVSDENSPPNLGSYPGKLAEIMGRLCGWSTYPLVMSK